MRIINQHKFMIKKRSNLKIRQQNYLNNLNMKNAVIVMYLQHNIHIA